MFNIFNIFRKKRDETANMAPIGPCGTKVTLPPGYSSYAEWLEKNGQSIDANKYIRTKHNL